MSKKKTKKKVSVESVPRDRGDYGEVHDGLCEFSWLYRCTRPAVTEMTFGQFDGWTYRYCEKHAEMMERRHE